MFRLSDIAIDPQAAVDGVWETYAGTFQVRIARANNRRYQQLLSEAIAQHGGRRLISDDEYSAIVARCMGTAIVTDWKGLYDDAGEEIPYSPERAAAILGDPRYQDFRDWVAMRAVDSERFRARAIEEEAKHLGEGSPGSSAGRARSPTRKRAKRGSRA